MRSNEFDSRIELQHYITGVLQLPAVHYRHYGRFNIVGATTQGREIREGIEEGRFIGWDDPRLVTLRALKRRGIVKEAIHQLARVCGMSKTQTNLDFSMIASINRQILDASAKRFFFIQEPIEITVEGAPSRERVLAMHPDKELGTRRFSLNTRYYIEKKDADTIEEGALIRLMDNMNIRKEAGKFVFVSESHEDFQRQGKKIIHWLPVGDACDCEVFMPDASVIKGKAEPAIKRLGEGEVVQFQRFGFCRLDENKDSVRFWYTHE
jgi:glutamyl-tRNA synthetase